MGPRAATHRRNRLESSWRRRWVTGREEIEELTPAVASAGEAGIDATGPLPADSVFNRAIAGEFDVVLALYHDQGILRSRCTISMNPPRQPSVSRWCASVDHGTAFDIAGKGVADATGMRAAMDAAQTVVAKNLGGLMR